MSYPDMRPRRLRRTPAMRRLVEETRVAPAELVLPMFVKEGLTEPRPITSMPGVLQHSRDSLRKAAVEAVQAGVGGIMLFGVPAAKDETGSAGIDPGGILNAAIRDVVAEVGDATVVMSDLCLDEFTSHGHCGLLAPDGTVDNDATLSAYAEMAVAQAGAGVGVVGPSGMMDGQVGVVRRALDAAGYHDVTILAYAAKYASAFYGPFREAVESALQGDRRTYQQDPANLRESLREVELDVAEGADIIMVKPALPYLDVVAAVRAAVDVPVAAYQISGEYAMVEAAAANGWIDRDRAVLETLTSIRRAGAQIILTYWAVAAARLLRDRYWVAGQCSALQGGGEGPRWEGRQGPSSALDCGTVRLDPGDNQARVQAPNVAAGLAETENACGADVRPGHSSADCGEAGTHPGVARSARSAEGIPAIHGGGGSQ